MNKALIIADVITFGGFLYTLKLFPMGCVAGLHNGQFCRGSLEISQK